jgi:hypothetical protein
LFFSNPWIPCHTLGDETLSGYTRMKDHLNPWIPAILWVRKPFLYLLIMEGCHICLPPVHGILAKHCVVALTLFVGDGNTAIFLPFHLRNPAILDLAKLTHFEVDGRLPSPHVSNLRNPCHSLVGQTCSNSVLNGKTAISLPLSSKESLPYYSFINLFILW